MSLLLRKVIYSIALLPLVMSAAFAQQKCEPAQVDKAYQQILYHYFQQDIHQALTQFSVLQQRCPKSLNKINQPGIDPMILKGGMSLAYGLEQQAVDIFNQLLVDNADLKTQTQAWLLLGKALFHKQQFEAAAQALGNISLSSANQYLDIADKDEWIYLQSQLSHHVKLAPASISPSKDYWLAELSDDSVFRQYVTYNKGLAQLQNGQYAVAIQTLEPLGNRQTRFFIDWLDGWWSPVSDFTDTEIDALRDRTNLTIGYAHLKNKQALQALDAFDRIRVDSLDTDSALLGYGWAAAQREEYQTALSAWQRLQKMPRSNEYVMESYLASSYAYEQAFAPTQALDNLKRGLARFDQETQFLQNQLNTINNQFFIQLAGNADWTDKVPDHLAAVMLSNEFRNQVQVLSQSLTAEAQMQLWQTQLDTFNLMLDERQQNFLFRAEQLRQNDLLLKLETLKVWRNKLSASIERAASEPALLADEQQMSWNTRLAKAKHTHQHIVLMRQQLQQPPLADSYAKRLQRIEGILSWQAMEQYPSRVWEAKKSLKHVDTLISVTQGQQARLQQHLDAKPKYDGQRQRIGVLRQKLEQQQVVNQSIQSLQLTELNQLFAKKIQQQIGQLASYTLQAQLATVRLNDKAFRKAQADKQGAQ
ncbi:tetratricopeptide repeat protein [Aliiglaciecola sp. LCG003]|uniref:tetratricopeptide repeat protein n=1 Tax=Aliiglaciecola sp. LCG003 TaxID=3053655 RepID=UPI002572231C|nr:tetratricopeptide repeat protein [Aliiglaciecola sp. LCG003]WJG08755.1 hypothetical protein QR722_15630 [Aliiglaciecola sp. LCG003]